MSRPEEIESKPGHYGLNPDEPEEYVSVADALQRSAALDQAITQWWNYVNKPLQPAQPVKRKWLP